MQLDATGLDAAEFFAAFASLEERERVEALLIDPAPADRDAVIAAAARSRQLHLNVTACGSLAEAQTLLAQRTFDVVYLEYWFGDETALPFIQSLAALPGSPCVVLTDLDAPDIRRLAFRAGAQAFLAKDDLGAHALESVTLTVLRPKLAATAG